MKRLLFGAIFALLGCSGALAQQPPAGSLWNGQGAGPLWTAAPIIGRSGSPGTLTLFPGTAPVSPANGTLWVTTGGLFAQVNGSAVGPLLGSAITALTGDVTATGSGSVSATVNHAPAGALTGTTLASGVTISSLTSFGNAPTIANGVLTGLPTGAGSIIAINGTNCQLALSCTVGAASILIGTTTIGGGTPNGLIYDSGGTVGNLATANSGVLVTSSGGAPSISTTLPNALAMGTPTSITLTNGTGLPVSTGLTGAGTGVLTALGINVGSAGAIVVNGGALGTPSGGVATNLTGLPLTTGVTGILPLANGGTDNNLTPSNGGIVYSDASKLQILAGTGTASQCLLSSSNAAPTWGACAGGAAVASVTNSDSSLTISPTTGAVVASLNVGHANTWTAVQTFTNSDIRLLGSSTGYTTLTSANASATNYTLTIPAVTDTMAVLGLSQTFTATNTFTGNINAGSIYVGGSGSPNLLISAGNVWGADASGHPYCDMRALGGGTGSATNDNTAWTNAASTCANGKIFFPCGIYHNNSGSPWTASVATTVEGAGEACTVIETNSTTSDVFACSGSGNQTTFRNFTIEGAGVATIPTAGYGINCSGGGVQVNNAHFENLEILDTYNGINTGTGTNDVINGNRLEDLYGIVAINNASGGTVSHNQLDNNSFFNGIGGTATFITYPGASHIVATNTTVTCGSFFYLAMIGGTTSSGSSSCSVKLVPTPMATTITDGTVTWQLIGNAALTLVNAGVQANVFANDMTSPAKYGVLVNGVSGVQVYSNNGIAGEITAGIGFENVAQYNNFSNNSFDDIGRVASGPATTGFPIYEIAGTTNVGNQINGNTINNAVDAAILVQSNSNNIEFNMIQGHNISVATFQAIYIAAATSQVNVSMNNITNSSPGAVGVTGTQTNLNIVDNNIAGATLPAGCNTGSVICANNN